MSLGRVKEEPFLEADTDFLGSRKKWCVLILCGSRTEGRCKYLKVESGKCSAVYYPPAYSSLNHFTYISNVCNYGTLELKFATFP